MPQHFDRTNVLGVGVSAINMDEAVEALLDARRRGESGYVCVTGVHGVIESQRDPELKRIHNRSFMTVPDGMPTVWMGLEQGFSRMGRVYGPDLMLRLMEATTDPDSFKCYDLGVRSQGDGIKNYDLGFKQDESVLSALKPRSAAQIMDREGHNELNEWFNHLKLKTEPEEGSLKPKTVDAGRPLTHFLYGATPEMLSTLKANLEAKFAGIQIVGTYAPPFRPLNDEEEAELAEMVASCQPDFFWVGLSTPKQEKFMASHSPANDGFKCYDLGVRCQSDLKPNHLSPNTESTDSSLKPNHLTPNTAASMRFPLDCGIMLGVGAAFPIHAGLQKDAPEWIKNSGLQWLHRLCQEPKRLWRRYLDIVPRFLGLAALQMLGVRKYSIEE